MNAETRTVTTAPSWRRALAGTIDIAVCTVAWSLLVWITWPGLPEVPWNWLDTLVDWFNAKPSVVLVPMVWVLVVGFGYNVAFQAFGRETLGKRALKLKTVDAHGRFPERKKAIAYCALRALSTVPLLAGHLWAIADPERRTLHDRLAKMWVVVEPKVEGPTGQ